MIRHSLLSFLVLALSAGIADASLITYGSRAAFNAAVSGQTMIDFEAQNPGGAFSFVKYNSNLTVGSVSFNETTSSRLYVLGNGIYGTSGLSSSYLNHNGISGDIVVNFAGGGIYSLGMDVGQVNPFSGPVGNMTISLSSGDQINLTGLQQLGNSSNPLTFVGFTSNTAITSITFRDTSDSTAIDNFAFSTAPLNAVPEPASLATWGVLGLAGLAFQSRRRRIA